MITSINHRIYILFIVLFFCKEGKANEPFRFIHYEIENGLSSNTVRSLCQDDQGFMWFGTENGLNRFDGQTIKVYRKEADNPGSIGNNYIFSLFEDTHKNLWVGTDEGIYLYNRTTDTFTPFTIPTSCGKVIGGQITGIQEDKYGNIWIASLEEGIYSYYPDSKEIKLYNNCFTSDITQSFSGKIYNIFVDSEDYLWVCGQLEGSHLYRYDYLTEKFETFGLDIPFNDPAFFSYTIAEDHSNILWLGTWSHGIWKLNRKTGRIQSFLAPGTPGGITHIHSILQYKPGILLIGSDDGLTVFNTITCEAETMKTSEFHKNSLSNNFVYPLYLDKEGGLWVGTYYGGINYAAPYSGAIKGYSHSGFTNSVSGQIISCFCEDDKGNIWIGSDDGGLSCFDPSTNRFTNYLPETGKNSLSYHNVHALIQDGNYLWIGTYSGGLNKLHIPTKKFTYYLRDRSQIKRTGDSSIYTLFIDRTDTLWIGTMSGIAYYDRQTDDFIPAIDTKTMVIGTLEDETHHLWFATLGNGIFKYNKQTGEWKHYEHNSDNPNSLISDLVTSLYIDNEGYLWIGTEEGLCCMDRQKETFKLVPIANEYRHVAKIIGDDNYLWITTNKGLYRFNPEDQTFRHFSKQDGLQNDQFCNNSGIRIRSGLLYLGTINGFNIINPRSIYVNRYVPPVIITNLQIFNQDATPQKYPSVLSGSIQTAEQIELSHRENVFSIEFAALSYTIPSKTSTGICWKVSTETGTTWETNGKQLIQTCRPEPTHSGYRVQTTMEYGMKRELRLRSSFILLTGVRL
ncbi:MAG: hypothetical protein LUH15_21315 [Tannerellaceae bacterium]|nr:hypothetical protein [Tannerellaceae bacterium]